MRTIVIIIFVIVTRVLSQKCNYDNSVELTNGTFKGVKYEEGEYFFDNQTGVYRGCICLKELCARKCCPWGQIYNESHFDCNDSLEEFNPIVWEGSELKQGFNLTANFYVFPFKMKCDKLKNEHRNIVADLTENYQFKTDGKLYVTERNQPVVNYSSDKYCIDNFYDPIESKFKFKGLVCYVPRKQSEHNVLTASCMFVSCFFIIITVAVYAILPELRSTIHGKVMIAYLMSFFAGLLILGTTVMVLIYDNISRNACTTVTFFIYFALLSAFFWLNVMTYDIYRKFNTMKVNIRTDDRLRFLRYCAYAFGIPTALTIILAGLEFSGLPKDDTFLPDIRRKTCFLSGTTRLVYLYGPILIICVANLILYALIARKFTQIKKQTQRLHEKHKQQVSVYIKLFIVVGVNWVLEVISSFYPDLSLYFMITDVYNILVGVIIFIIFVCKKKILLALKQRFKALCWVSHEKEQTSSTVSTTVTSAAQSMENIGMATVDSGKEN